MREPKSFGRRCVRRLLESACAVALAAGLGLLQAALPLGSLICALVLAHRSPLKKAGPTMLWAVAIFGLTTIVFGFSRWFWLSLLMLVVSSAIAGIWTMRRSRRCRTAGCSPAGRRSSSS